MPRSGVSASERMARWSGLYGQLLSIDEGLKVAFAAGEDADEFTVATARDLLNQRATVCESLLAVGFHAHDITEDIDGEVEFG